MRKRRVNNSNIEICDGNNNVILTISESADTENQIAKMKLIGKLSNETAHDFEDEIMALFSVISHIELDLSETVYIASMALRVLLSMQQFVDEADDAWLHITGISSEVRTVLEETGFDDILDISIAE